MSQTGEPADTENGAGERQRVGIIGWPVAHSRSPLIHNGWIHQLSLNAHYDKCPVSPDADFRGVLEVMMRVGFTGANVTIPHKENAFHAADRLDPIAAKLGAVNTLHFKDGEIIGSNTDGAGFVAALDAATRSGTETPDWRDAPALILGAGGATRAILVALAEAGLRDIRLSNRTRARAEPLLGLAQETPAQCEIIDWDARAEGAQDCGLLVNTTSLGMQGAPPLDMALSGLRVGAVVNDIVYTPLETNLLRAARAADLVAVDGLGMLMNQAALSFETWFGVRPPLDDLLRQRLIVDLGEK